MSRFGQVPEHGERLGVSVSRFEHGFLEALYQADDIGLGLIDAELRYVRVNETLAEINGVSAHEHEGHTVREVLPQFADLLEPMLRQVIDSRSPLVDIEISGPTPADPNADRHFRGGYLPIFEGDEVIGVAGLVLETTERVRTDRELKEQARQIYENVVQELTVGRLALDEGDSDAAYEAVGRALAQAKEIASKVLLDEVLPDV